MFKLLALGLCALLFSCVTGESKEELQTEQYCQYVYRPGGGHRVYRCQIADEICYREHGALSCFQYLPIFMAPVPPTPTAPFQYEKDPVDL